MIQFNKTNESNSRWLQVYVLACAVLLLTNGIASATEIVRVEANYWNQFRGPNGDGKSLAKNLPVQFSETKNVRWKTPIHDKGWSSPVVWGSQIWLTTGREDGSELFAICVNLESGEIVYDIKVFDVTDPQEQYGGLNTHATPTPIVEDGRIYVHFGSYGTACLDTKTGQKLWERRDLNCDHRVRPASSPIIDRDSLFLHFDGVDDLLFMVSDQGFASCLEAKTGRELWKRRLRAGGDHWASPVYADSRIYFCGKKGIVSVIAVAREFELLAENRLEASFIASAAVAGDAMILRSLTHLYCVAEANEMARHQCPSQ